MQAYGYAAIAGKLTKQTKVFGVLKRRVLQPRVPHIGIQIYVYNRGIMDSRGVVQKEEFSS